MTGPSAVLWPHDRAQLRKGGEESHQHSPNTIWFVCPSFACGHRTWENPICGDKHASHIHSWGIKRSPAVRGTSAVPQRPPVTWFPGSPVSQRTESSRGSHFMGPVRPPLWMAAPHATQSVYLPGVFSNKTPLIFTFKKIAQDQDIHILFGVVQQSTFRPSFISYQPNLQSGYKRKSTLHLTGYEAQI